MMVIVAYDVNTMEVAGQRRLRRVAKVCSKFGQRVQNSVFECEVTPADYLLLKHDLFEIMDEEVDSLRFYNLGSKYSNKYRTPRCSTAHTGGWHYDDLRFRDQMGSETLRLCGGEAVIEILGASHQVLI